MAGAYVLDFDWSAGGERSVLQGGHWRNGASRGRLDRLAGGLGLRSQVRWSARRRRRGGERALKLGRPLALLFSPLLPLSSPLFLSLSRALSLS